MPEAPISYKLEGATFVIQNLKEINSEAKDLSPAFAQIANDMVKSHEMNFRMHGTRFGNQWPPRKYVYPWKILEKTGKLSRGFKGSSTSTSAEVTNTVSYAKYHHFGTKKLPVRNLIGIADSGAGNDITSAVNRIRHHLKLERMM